MITRPITRPVTAPLARAVTANFGNIWNPRALFALGEQGWWFDNNDLGTMFQDAAGTTPVTAAGQPVGLQLDKSRGLVRGSELVTNGTFEAGTTGWTAFDGNISSDGSSLTVTEPGGGTGVSARAYQAISCTVGKTYEVAGSVVAATSAATANIGIGTAISGAAVASVSAIGAIRFVFTATSATHYVRLTTGATAGDYATFSGISVRELPGNHRFQATAASRPILRQNATTGAYYFETDGSDDWMQTNAVNFTGTDKVTLFTGVRKLSDAAFGMLAELSTIVGANSGSFYIGCPAAGAYEVGRKASGTAAYVPSAIYPAPVSSVISTEIDFSAAQELALFRVNGAATGTPGAVDSGSGNFGNYPAYFFRRGGTTLPFNGHEYGSICVGRLCSAAEIRAVERLLAQRVGVALA